MLRGTAFVAVLAALALPAAAGAWTKTMGLMPGVTYKKEVRWVHGGPLVTHVVSAPKPGGLYDLKPVLAGGMLGRRERLTSMQRRLSGRATVAGVNGDYFNFRSGRPTGMYMRDGVLASRPVNARSTVGIAFDGTLRVRRWRYFGSWQAEGHAAHPMKEFNRPLADPPGSALFTSTYGRRTPRAKRTLDVILAGVPPAIVNGSLRARVVGYRWGGGSVVPRGGAVLQTRGRWRKTAVREARPGRDVTLRVRLNGFWTDVADALGGGPVLVRHGKAIYRSGEAFTRSQLVPRHPRTAVGQKADGTVMLVVADGRSRASMGLRNWELALELVRLGAVTAMAFDGGGSSTLAFNGRTLNRPSDGYERSLADGLILFYHGVYAPRLGRAVVSPNGDGVADVQRLTAKIVRRSQVHVRLLRPNGTVAWRLRDTVGRRVIRHDLRRARQNGRWRWIVRAVDLRGRESRMERRFTVNNTLGFLRLSKTRMRVYTGRGGKLDASVRLTKRSSLAVTVRRSSDGRVVRRLYAKARQAPGRHAFRWNGRNNLGRVVRSGTYVVRVRAGNDLGRIALEKRVRVRRLKRPG